MQRNDQLDFNGLLDTLSLLIAQARAYERALPAENFQARAVAAVMGQLAQQAINEAHDLCEQLRVAESPASILSKRELEVLRLAAEGCTNKEIAYRLGLSKHTVQFHLNSIFGKTGAASRAEAVAYAIRQGWL